MVEWYPILSGAALAAGGAAEVGNKAWNLMRMARAGLPVPPAFVLPTHWCAGNHEANNANAQTALAQGIAQLEAATGLGFGAGRRPLLVSVRSGASISMPGMMETVLDIGLNDKTVESLIRMTGNPRLAWDSYRRLVQSYAEVVAALSPTPFDALVAAAVAAAEVENERDLDHRDLRGLTRAMLDCYQTLTGAAFPADPHEQLAGATAAVFRSWDAPKAATYRRLNGISDDIGTAVTIQTMVYGNAGGASGAGVGFTRNPATGAHSFYFDFQFNGQGEDVVAGRHTLLNNDRLQTAMPDVWKRLNTICGELEHLFLDAQDFEFTVQSGALFLLQARRAKRTNWAAVKIAVDMVSEALVTPVQALSQLDGIDLTTVTHTTFVAPLPKSLARAQVASMGVTTGAIALDPSCVKRFSEAGKPAILVRQDTVTTDIEGMALAVGILTASGGRTSHAAVVARQLGKVCLVACTELHIDMTRRQCTIGGIVLNEGDFISLDGDGGVVYPGQLAIVTERPDRSLAAIASWREARAA